MDYLGVDVDCWRATIWLNRLVANLADYIASWEPLPCPMASVDAPTEPKEH